MKVVAQNRKAYHDYFIDETYEAGIVLKGTEIKSVRKGSANLKDSYIHIKDGEAFIVGMHIAPYAQGNIFNHDPTRTRKLLLHKKQIRKLARETQETGYTLVPTKLYFGDGSKVKLEVALARGKKLYDKRQDMKAKDAKRDIEKVMKEMY